MLCKKCGSNLPDDAKYCEKCGADQIRPDTSNTRLKWIAICCGGAILFVIISGFIISMPSSGSYSKDVIISKELDSMALTINDLSGWKTGKTTRMAELQGINTENIYKSSFFKSEGMNCCNNGKFILQNITRYASLDDAKNEYLSVKGKISEKGKIANFKVKSVIIGNEGFGYEVTTDFEDSYTAIVFFRTGNIIVMTQYSSTNYPCNYCPNWVEYSSYDSPSMSALKYATIIARRMQ